MIAAFHTAIEGWDVILAVLVVIGVAVLEYVVPIRPSWWTVATLALVSVTLFALLVTY